MRSIISLDTIQFSYFFYSRQFYDTARLNVPCSAFEIPLGMIFWENLQLFAKLHSRLLRWLIKCSELFADTVQGIYQQ